MDASISKVIQGTTMQAQRRQKEEGSTKRLCSSNSRSAHNHFVHTTIHTTKIDKPKLMIIVNRTIKPNKAVLATSASAPVARL